MHKTSNSLPQAFVSVGKNKSRLKIYNGKTIFIKDGEEFQIELFNPTTKTIGAKIFINGNSISNSMLVIKPGERSYLERYLDDNKKFLYETYNVENSKEVKEAIKQNGLVKVEFYNEKTVVPPIQTWGSSTTYVSPYTYNPYNPTITIGDPNPPYYIGSGGTGIVNCNNTSNWCYTSGVSGSNGPEGPVGLSGNVGPIGIAGNSTTGSFYCSSNLGSLSSGTITTTASTTQFVSPGITTKETDHSTVETGRIEKGDVSSQTFGNYYGDFESYSFATTEYHLMPESQKPVEVKEIRQYCPGCRTRVKKSSWKFCPSCGESLD